jgi:hypothetical protein
VKVTVGDTDPVSSRVVEKVSEAVPFVKVTDPLSVQEILLLPEVSPEAVPADKVRDRVVVSDTDGDALEVAVTSRVMVRLASVRLSDAVSVVVAVLDADVLTDTVIQLVLVTVGELERLPEKSGVSVPSVFEKLVLHVSETSGDQDSEYVVEGVSVAVLVDDSESETVAVDCWVPPVIEVVKDAVSDWERVGERGDGVRDTVDDRE